ncbi:MAG: PEGA domain-containing protein [Magnetococcales bacterium]|nr:PEGA domain-containing protein [Magnetococcales bacterium]
MNAMIRQLLTLTHARMARAASARARLFSMSGGALLTAAFLWVAVATPPMAAPTAPSENSFGASLPAVAEAALPVGNLPAPPPPEAAINPSETLLLRIETKPAGATIYLDGQKLGTTPFTVGRVKIGMHALRLEKENFSPVSYDLELNEDTVVDLTLDSLPTPPPPPTALRKSTTSGERTASRDTQPASKTQEMVASLTTHVTSDAPPSERAPITTPIKALPSGASADRETTVKLPDTKDGASRESDPKEQAARARQAKQLLAQKAREEKELLRDAEDHFKEDRLTRPKGKNALEIYQKLLQSETLRAEAHSRIQQIIARLLELGREDMDEWRLVQPKESNALGRFRAVLEIDPQNADAKAGLEEIVDRFLSLAKRFANDPDQARDHIRQAESILPGRPHIADVRAALFPKERDTSDTRTPPQPEQP